MSPRTRRGVAILAGALLVAIAFRVLDTSVPARLDIALAVATLALAIALLAHREVIALPPRAAVLAVPLLLLTVALLWRDSATLFALNLSGIVVLFALASPRAHLPRLERSGVSDLAMAGLHTTVYAVLGTLPLALREIAFRELPAAAHLRRLRAAGAGMLVALPVVLVFGGLFRSADPVYDRMISDLLSLDVERIVEWLLFVGSWTWLVAGYVHGAFPFGRTSETLSAPPPGAGVSGATAVAAALLSVSLVLASFIGVQFTYLFGGTEAMAASGLGHAEYARRGFFELVAVASLSVPLLLLADWLLEKRDRRAVARCRLIGVLMVAMLFVILASALDRMRLYTQQYGLTELRFYTTAFMGWLALLLGWLVATMLRGRRRRFAVGAPASAFMVLGTLNLLNPDGIIARVNLGRSPAPAGFDTAYAAQLGADAVPVLLDLASALPGPERCELLTRLHERWGEAAEPTRWNIAYAAARRRIAGRGDGPCAATLLR